MKTVGIVSLGCDKNRIDSEIMLNKLASNGYSIVADAAKAQIIIVNTCAFIEPARREAIDTIFEMARYKKQNCELLVVTGCLPQKYVSEMENDLPEVDIFCGTDACASIVSILDKKTRNNVLSDAFTKVEEGERTLTTPSHFAYLRIADGCDNNCTYCLIPSIRGKFRSRKIENIVSEAESLTKNGAKELIIIAQDSTRYGYDQCGKSLLVDLLRKLSSINSLKQIRLLYCYPELINDELIDEISKNSKIVKYLDIPFQHVSSSVLKRMGRRSSYESTMLLIRKLRSKIPEIAIRSTFIIGFPGESDEDFNLLCNFLKQSNLANAGFFSYSREDGTPAAKLDGQLDEKIKEKRLKQIAKIQARVVRENNERTKDDFLDVVIDSYVGTQNGKQVYSGRSYRQAPDVDGEVYVFSIKELLIGESYLVRITDAKDYDLIGEYR